MGELAQMIALWRRARQRGQQVCLATVVHVEGSSYRKPGARMLLTSGGERSGTVSGGCLEGEIARKAWWLTENGPALEQYQSSFEEDAASVPWGLGCGGTIWILLERDPEPVMEALVAAREAGRPSVIVTSLGQPGTVWIFNSEPADGGEGVQQAGRVAWLRGESLALDSRFEPAAGLPAWVFEYLAPPPRVTIFGAGDDALPVARFAAELGWRVTVADGRANLLRPGRFPDAVQLLPLTYGEPAPFAYGDAGLADAPSLAAIPTVETGAAAGEFAVVLTHSWEQDRALLCALLPAGLAYLGLLGPRHRTQRLLEQVAPVLGWSMERCWSDLHAPVGLDLGARDPAAIALSIVADLLATTAARKVTVQRPAESRTAAAMAPPQAVNESAFL